MLSSTEEPKSFNDSSSDQVPQLHRDNLQQQPLTSDQLEQEYDQEHVVEEFNPAPIKKTPTLLERVQSSYSFFNQNLKSERRGLLIKFLLIYLTMGVLVLSIFSIYWGSMYKRNDRLVNLKMLVVVEDTETIDGVEPFLGRSIAEVVKVPKIARMGGWKVFNTTEFAKEAAKHNNENNFEAEVTRLIHQQDYWGSIYIKANATYNLYNAIKNGDTSYNVSENTVVSIYETGRDFVNVPSFIVSTLRIVNEAWQNQFVGQVKTNISDLLLQDSSFNYGANNLEVLTTPLSFVFRDLTTYTNSVIIAPSQVGLIYMIIVTFFGFNFFSDTHQQVARFNLKKHHFLLYRILSSVISWFVLSLFFSLVSLAMQISFTQTFGRSGFLVYWMTAFLTMWAVGAMNELMAMIFIMIYPPLLGFWMLFWVIINISPTFTPIALTAKFFRYGYGLPIHNSYEATKVIFFNTTKRRLGLNYGILVAWVVLATLLLIPVTALFGKTMAKRAMAARKQEEEARQEIDTKDLTPDVEQK